MQTEKPASERPVERPVRPCDVPCPKCGNADVQRRFFAQGEHMETKTYNRSPSKYASGQSHSYSAHRDHLQNTCKCCCYVWQTLPLAKQRKRAALVLPNGADERPARSADTKRGHASAGPLDWRG